MVFRTVVFLFLSVMGVGEGFADISTLRELAVYSDPLVANGKGNMSYSLVYVDSSSVRARSLAQQDLEATPKDAILVRLNQGNGTLYFAFSGVKMRCNERATGLIPGERSFRRYWQSAYNGEKTDLLRLDGVGKGGLIIPFGTVYEKNTILVHRFDPRYHAMTIFGVPVGSFLNGAAKEGTLTGLAQKEDESVEGVLCHVVTGVVSGTDIRYTVWIAPGQMYRPKKIEVRTGDGLKIVRNQLVKHAGEVWFPKQTIVEDYYFDQTTGTQVLAERYTLTLGDDYAVNTDVPDTLFNLTFPKGIKIYDWRTGSSHTAE